MERFTRFFSCVARQFGLSLGLSLGFCFLPLAVSPLTVEAASLRCSECGRDIQPKAQYFTSEGRVYCSQACFKAHLEKTLPKCASCGKSCNGGFQSGGKYYCSQACLSTIWPSCALCGKRAPKGTVLASDPNSSKFFCDECSKLPRCFVCQFPGKGISLPDGRHLCVTCQKMAVADPQDVLRMMDEAREQMDKVLGLNTNHKIALYVTDSSELKRNSSNFSPGLELGLFSYKATIETVTTTRSNRLGQKSTDTQSTVTDERYSIYVLDYITKERLYEVIVHELAHDWMQEYYPNITELKIKEGWAEYVAALMNKAAGREHLNKRMDSNPDPVYGDGYRLVRDYAVKHGFTNLSKLFTEYNSAK